MGTIVGNLIAAVIVVLRRFVQLGMSPYTAMRNISKDVDCYQISVIFIFVYAYFMYAVAIREKVINPLVLSSSAITTFGFFTITIGLSVLFFHSIGVILQQFGKTKMQSITALTMLFVYSLLPTLLWFTITSTLFVMFPPPRYTTPLGKLFSVIFIVMSITLLLWRLVLWYLSLRFAYRAHFFTILGAMILFGVWFVPYTFMMYWLGVFKIPFI